MELINGNSSLLVPTNGSQFIRMIRLLTNKPQPYPAAIMQSFVNLNFTKERQANLKKRKTWTLRLIFWPEINLLFCLQF